MEKQELFKVEVNYTEASEVLALRLGMSRDEIDTMIAGILNSKDSDETLRLIQFLVLDLRDETQENEVK